MTKGNDASEKGPLIVLEGEREIQWAIRSTDRILSRCNNELRLRIRAIRFLETSRDEETALVESAAAEGPESEANGAQLLEAFELKRRLKEAEDGERERRAQVRKNTTHYFRASCASFAVEFAKGMRSAITTEFHFLQRHSENSHSFRQEVFEIAERMVHWTDRLESAMFALKSEAKAKQGDSQG